MICLPLVKSVKIFGPWKISSYAVVIYCLPLVQYSLADTGHEPSLIAVCACRYWVLPYSSMCLQVLGTPL